MGWSLKLIDLLEIYRLTKPESDTLEMLRDMCESAGLDERIDKETLCNLILAECGAMYPVWNTTNTFVVLAAANMRARMGNYTRMLDALAIEYNVIDNYDFKEVENKITGSTRVKDDSDTRTPNITETNTGKVSADNEIDFSNRTQTINAETGNETDVLHSADVYGETNDNEKARTGRTKEAQGMILQEFEVAKLNIYKIIVSDFAEYAMLSVY